MVLYPMDQSSCRNRNIIFGIIACLILAGIPAVMAADGTTATSSGESNITVITWPAGAAVYLNGEYRGATPIKVGSLSPGTYKVEVSLAGFKNETFTRTLSAGSMHEIGINLISLSQVPAPTGSGSIAVDSSPGGATVTIDGKPAGTTPAGRAALVLNDIPAGSHVVTVELAGYPPFTSTVTVIKNQVVKVNADLETRSPAITGTPTTATPIATTDRQKQVPLSPLTAVAAAGLIGLAAVFRRP
jgi:hypothetical protein